MIVGVLLKSNSSILVLDRALFTCFFVWDYALNYYFLIIKKQHTPIYIFHL